LKKFEVGTKEIQLGLTGIQSFRYREIPNKDLNRKINPKMMVSHPVNLPNIAWLLV
jgi:hypothetical protein